MIKNIDSAIIINREVDDTQEDHPEYLGFKLEKLRGKPNKDKIFVFLHPFDLDNGILLKSDLDGKPLSRRTIEEFNPLSARRDNKLLTRSMEESSEFLKYCSNIGEDFGDNEDDSFIAFMNMRSLGEEESEKRVKSAEELAEKAKQHAKLRQEQLKHCRCEVRDNKFVIREKSFNIAELLQDKK